MSRYADRVVQWQPLAHDDGLLLDLVDAPHKETATRPFPKDRKGRVTLVLLNGNLNHHLDIEGLLRGIRPSLNRQSRVVLVAYNPYLRPLYEWASRLGLRRGPPPQTFVTGADLDGLAKLAGFAVIRERPVLFSPVRLLGLGTLLNRTLPVVPGLRQLSLASVIVLRPILADARTPTLSVVIPARNERGNIAPALGALAALRDRTLEVIFVEGHSTDGTWDEIQELRPRFARRLRLRAFQQRGRGKADAVRTGFAHATGDLLTILDADLTVPPALLLRLRDAYAAGLADFVNGSRLVYPMETSAMRFLNRVGNKFFAKALSYVLGMTVTDTLCGTKLLSRRDYERLTRWQKDFGAFDPFGDFELLFGAATLALGSIDLPLRYRARTYGTTNIARFRDGAYLFKMTAIGLARIGLGPAPRD